MKNKKYNLLKKAFVTNIFTIICGQNITNVIRKVRQKFVESKLHNRQLITTTANA
jgi:hypothetical protein